MTHQSGYRTPPGQGSVLENLDRFLQGMRLSPDSASSPNSRPDSLADESKGQFSFGIELEFAVAYLRQGEEVRDGQDKKTNNYQGTYAKVFSVPHGHSLKEFLENDIDDANANAQTSTQHSSNNNNDSDSEDSDTSGSSCYWQSGDEDKVFARIRETINNSLDPSTSNANRVCLNLNKSHSKWDVVHDSTIRLPGDLFIKTRYKGVRWMGVEITSPALWNTPQSFAEVRNVIETLKQQYWMVIDTSCGLHIHVSRGEDWPSLRELRRTAALLFAADPLLAQLHPEDRLKNIWCLGNRNNSRVSQGMTHKSACAEAEEDSYNTPPTMQLPPEPLDQYLLFDDETPAWSTSSSATSADPPLLFSEPHRRIERGALDSYNVIPADKTEPPSRYQYYSDFDTPRALLPCIHDILYVSRSGALSRLMHGHVGAGRCAYNFNNFEADTPILSQGKPTIEFRQCAATLNVDEIFTFTRLFIGLCEKASSAPFSLIWSAIQRCAVLERRKQQQLAVAVSRGWSEGAQQTYASSGPEFDVFDLLTMLGLEEEARALQQVMWVRNGLGPKVMQLHRASPSP